RALAALLFGGVGNFVAFAGKDLVEVIAGAMKFLGAENEFDAGHLQEFSAAALGHAAHETERLRGTTAASFNGDVLHFVKSLLFGGIAHTAGVEKDDVGERFRGSDGITAR